jgi:hypothetical protein
MIGAIRQYAREEALPRRARILGQPQVVGAIVLGLLTSMYGAKWPLAGLKMSETTTMLLTYAAVAFGFCVAGMALVLTLPNESFVSLLMKHKLGRNEQSSYSDLLFVFSWTAIIHWTTVVLSIVAVCIRGGDRTVLNTWDGLGWKVMIGSLAGLSLYALTQFLMTVITLSQVGRLYIREFPPQRRQG